MAYFDDEKVTSEYNEAIFQISRLHNIWLESKILREKGKLVLYKWKLDSASVELWNDANRLDEVIEDKEKKFITKLEKLDEEIAEAEKSKIWKNFYLKLIQKEKLLKEIQERAGKGARYKPADDDYM